MVAKAGLEGGTFSVAPRFYSIRAGHSSRAQDILIELGLLLARVRRRGDEMCRSIKTLRGLEPTASEEEVRAAALQFVRKISGYRTPSRANQCVFDVAVDDVAAASRRLLESLTSMSGSIPRTTTRPRSTATLERA